MNEHTPAPWHVENIDRDPTYTIHGPNRTWGLATVHLPLSNDMYYVQLKQAKANARLIASAPDLLEALRFFVDHPGVSQLCTANSDVMTAARAAIAKATGAN